jgi:putative transposase
MARVARQLGFSFRTWGGARKGAGRPPNGERAGVSHLRRPAQSRHHPLHVTLRVQRGVRSLRDPALFRTVRQALADGKDRFGFSLIQFSVQRDHLHLIAEAHDRRALSRGIQGLSIRVARAVNRQLERQGRLFADRYHARALTTPRAVKFALRYVLLNARKHAPAPPSHGLDGIIPGFVDACSSAPWFRAFARPEALAFGAQEARDDWQRASGSTEPPVLSPHTWLLRTCLQRHGTFDSDDAPGSDVNGGIE